jgi:hypothetical protein
MATSNIQQFNPETAESNCNDALTQYRINMIESTLEAVRENLIKLAQLEQKHIETKESLTRAFDSMNDINSRLREVEKEMPTLKLVRGWVIAGFVGIISLLGIAIFKLFTIGIH